MIESFGETISSEMELRAKNRYDSHMESLNELASLYGYGGVLLCAFSVLSALSINSVWLTHVFIIVLSIPMLRKGIFALMEKRVLVMHVKRLEVENDSVIIETFNNEPRKELISSITPYRFEAVDLWGDQLIVDSMLLVARDGEQKRKYIIPTTHPDYSKIML